MKFEVESVRIDVSGHMAKVQGEKFWKFAATEWHRLYRPYVPFKEGILYSTVDIQAGNGQASIEHTAPYAHYIYEGIVYGPNVPIIQGGAVVGYFSPEAPKHSTGKKMQFSKLFSGKAARHWDKAAAPTQKPLLVKSLQGFVDSGVLNFAGG